MDSDSQKQPKIKNTNHLICLNVGSARTYFLLNPLWTFHQSSTAVKAAWQPQPEYIQDTGAWGMISLQCVRKFWAETWPLSVAVMEVMDIHLAWLTSCCMESFSGWREKLAARAYLHFYECQQLSEAVSPQPFSWVWITWNTGLLAVVADAVNFNI